MNDDYQYNHPPFIEVTLPATVTYFNNELFDHICRAFGLPPHLIREPADAPIRRDGEDVGALTCSPKQEPVEIADLLSQLRDSADDGAQESPGIRFDAEGGWKQG